MMHSRKCSSYELFFGLIFFVVGALILLQTLGIVLDAVWDFIWPVILIALGLKLIVSGSKEQSHMEGFGDCCEMEEVMLMPLDEMEAVEEMAKPKAAKKPAGKKRGRK